MPKTWTELTPGEIDALEGDALSWAVGEAMGYRVFVGSCTMQLCAERDGGMRYWRPHNDANQALEVWAELDKRGDYHLALRATENELYYPPVSAYWWSGLAFEPIAEGTSFCEAICRAYLKARLEE